jgi:hypothetical protein
LFARLKSLRKAAWRNGSIATWLRVVAAAISLAIAAYVVVTTLLMVIGNWSSVPSSDHWDLLIFSPEQVSLGWLFAQDNEHREALPKLILAADAFLFAETGVFAVACTIALAAGLVWFFIIVPGRTISRDLVDIIWIAGIASTLLFSAMQYENLLLAVQPGFIGVGVAAACCFACLTRGRGLLSLSLAIGFATIAVYSVANGILVPLLAIPLASWAGRPKPQLAALAVAFVLLLSSYLYGYTTPVAHSDPLRSLLEPSAVIPYLVAELGTPIGLRLFDQRYPVRLAVGFAFGAVGLALFLVFATALLRRGRNAARVQLLLIALAAFGIGSAVLTALGRVKFGFAQAVSSRYTSWVLLFWLALTLLVASEIWQRRRNLRLAAMGLSVPCLLAVAVQQQGFVKVGREFVLPRHEAASALLAGVNDDDVMRAIHPTPSYIAEQATKLRAHHLALFAEPWSDWLGTPLSEHSTLSQAGQCRGAIDWVLLLPHLPGAQGRLTGWATGAAGQRVDRIVITDSAGAVVGYALGGFAASSEVPIESAWHGHFSSRHGDVLTAYALLNQDRTACPLAHSLTTSRTDRGPRLSISKLARLRSFEDWGWIRPPALSRKRGSRGQPVG